MTAAQRQRFLAELAVTGNVQFACAAAGITRAQAYAYRDASATFEKLWRAQIDHARERARARAAA